ncbi:replication protein RepA, partial [Enterococcus faecalis]|nr:replication protein RepA [Enterococcus faecalis]
MTNIKERGYSYQNSYSELFWKFPQFLLKNKKYKSMKDSSKIAYMLFKDKISLALTNNWIDEDGMIYLIFQQKDLMEMLNCYQGKVKSTLDELEKYGLLEVLRGGFDAKAGKNIANKYYLLQPELEKEDLYLSTNTT